MNRPPDLFATNASDLPEPAGAALSHLVEAGYPRIEPPILQPASVFLDMSGEAIRGRLFLTTDASGAEFCLRPEYTIPVCRAYLMSPLGGAPVQYSYLGPVFRAKIGESGEAGQVGLESFGRTDTEAADAEIFATAIEAATQAGAPQMRVRLGDTALFDRMLQALELPDIWLRRIRRGLARGRSLDSILAEANSGAARQTGVLAALERSDSEGAKSLVQDLLAISGITAVGGRTAGEIADRFLDQASLRAGAVVPDEKRAMLQELLSINGDPDTVSRQIRSLARTAALNLDEAMDSFDQRSGFMAARGIDIRRLDFDTAFIRDLDYYTGFVFEAFAKADTQGTTPLIGGGRYDRLARRLGAERDIPAVGAAIWIDRLARWDAAR